MTFCSFWTEFCEPLDPLPLDPLPLDPPPLGPQAANAATTIMATTSHRRLWVDQENFGSLICQPPT